MLMNNMNVFQSNGLYYVFNEQGELKSMIYLPHDGQLLADFKTLDLMTKAMAYRWGILKPSRKRSYFRYMWHI